MSSSRCKSPSSTCTRPASDLHPDPGTARNAISCTFSDEVRRRHLCGSLVDSSTDDASAVTGIPDIRRLADCICSARERYWRAKLGDLAHGESRVKRAAPIEAVDAWIASTVDPVVVTDADGRVLALNPAFGRIFSVSDSLLPTEPVEDLIIASRYRAAYRAARRRVLTAGPPSAVGSTSEFVAVRADGGEFTANLSFARASEDPKCLVTWLREVTGGRMVVTETLKRTALYERTEELAGFGSWDWNPGSHQLQWSDNLFRIYGLQPAEILPSQEYVLAHCHPGDRARVRQAAAQLGRTGRRPEVRYRYVWPDGTVRYLMSTVVLAAQADGPPGKVIGTIQDVTDQHQAQRELAARFAVSDALSDWEPGGPGARRLVRGLAEALEFEVGVMWIPRDDALVAWEVWQARALHSATREADLSKVRLRRGDGLAGSAWASGVPARIADLTDDAVSTVSALDGRTGVHGSLAVPATFGAEVLAVLTFASGHQSVLTDQFMRSLLGIGYEIGHFLARRRGELSTPALSARELQVLQLSATGFPRRKIAGEIGLSEATVKTHLEHIYKKLGVPDRASAVAKALRQGLIT
jgi:PAS domain S-box-containing protein